MDAERVLNERVMEQTSNYRLERWLALLLSLLFLLPFITRG